ITVGAVGTIVHKDHPKIHSRFTAHSIRIGSAIAAMQAGLSLAQICAIGGWNCKALNKVSDRAIIMGACQRSDRAIII
ncbi:11967_t:CDS:2, partial [Ambispora leptoticha]